MKVVRTRLISLSWAFILSVLLLGCEDSSSRNSRDVIDNPSKNVAGLTGDMWFNSTGDQQDYLHFIISGNNFKGTIYTLADGFFGGVKIDFDGTILKDSILKLTVHDSSEGMPTSLTLAYTYDGKTLQLDGELPWYFLRTYDLSLSNTVPDFSDYGTIEELEHEALGEYLENVFLGYYESVMPDPNRHFGGLHEYLQLLQVADTIVGYGAGLQDGEPIWLFDFTGHIQNDTLLDMIVNYWHNGIQDTTIHEVWFQNPQNGELKLFGYDRPENGRRFVPVPEGSFIPVIRDSLNSLDARVGYSKLSASDLYNSAH